MPDGFNMLQQLMGGAENDDPMAMMGRIQRLQKLMNNSNSVGEVSKTNNENKQEIKSDISTQENRHEQMLYTALPFIQQPFRNMVFNMTKFMEVQRILNRKEEDVVINARERNGSFEKDSNSNMDMLQAIKPFLNNNERQQIDMMVKFMNMGSMFNTFTQNNGEQSSENVDNPVDNVGSAVDKVVENDA